MSTADSDSRITSKHIELTVRNDTVDLAESADRDGLVTQLKEGLALDPETDVTVVGSYPLHQKLLLQLSDVHAKLLVRAVKLGAFESEGVVDAYVCPSAPAREADLDFERQPMIRWFTPIELVRAGVKAVLSTLFGSYADRREVQALQAVERAELRRSAVEPGGRDSAGRSGSPLTGAGTAEREVEPGLDDVVADEVCDFSDRDELWIDYIADLGDGWDPTYTMARLLGEERLDIEYAGQSYSTRRGDVLVMGGDQVYPTATRKEYNDRLVGPYRSSLPCVIGDEAPRLFAIPGNHDWYDGLTSFTRLFCQQRWIGGWQTEQVRSYFAIKLPHDWWLWGIDVQLESDIDLPQFKYFETLANHMEAGSKIILCTAEPSWVYAAQKGAEAYRNLEYFERKIIRANDLDLVVGLAGDLHTYARYEEDPRSTASETGRRGPRQRFISGGGGAYLYPSHQLPERLDLPSSERSPDGADDSEPENRERYTRKSVFPDEDSSRRLSFGATALPFKNWKFAGILGLFYLLFAWITQSATKIPLADEVNLGPSFIEKLESFQYLSLQGIEGMCVDFWRILRHSPTTAIIVGLLFAGLVGFADKKGMKKFGLGIVHTAGHVVLALLLMWTFAEVNLGLLGLGVDSPGQVGLFAAEMLVVGSLLGGMLLGVYMLLSNWMLALDREIDSGTAEQPGSEGEKLKGVHANEIFSSQSIADYKNFLRLQIRENGDLAIHPVGVEKVCTVWRFNENAVGDESWFDPGEGAIGDRASLIEEPIVIPSS